MNARMSSILILAAALGAPALIPVSAEPSASSAVGYWASKVTATRWNDLLARRDADEIVAGASQYAVVAALGQPVLELSPDVWVFDSCRPDLPEAQARGCNLLVITFAQGKVSEMRFVNHPAAEVIANNLKSERPERYASLR